MKIVTSKWVSGKKRVGRWNWNAMKKALGMIAGSESGVRREDEAKK